jgi:hypothetical protein
MRAEQLALPDRSLIMHSNFDTGFGAIGLAQVSARVAAISLGFCLGLSSCGSSGPGGEQAAGAASDTAGNSGRGGSAGAAETGASGSGGETAQLGGACDVSIRESAPSSADHLVLCSATAYPTNPPSGGPHYAIWPQYKSYDFALPDGFLVHALEHGAVVFWYNCPEGCADEVAEVEAFIAALPEDPLCAGSGRPRRVVLTPSPRLTSRWAASAWGFALSAACFDAPAFEAFYADHYGQGPERLCNPGSDFTADPCAPSP